MSDGVHAQSYYMLANNKSASDYIFEGKLKFSMGTHLSTLQDAVKKSTIQQRVILTRH